MAPPLEPKNPLDIIIVGAGIAGLAAATGLSLKGHRVRVLEAKDRLNEFGASIGITANAVKILKAWGLQAAFKPVVTENAWVAIRDAASNELIGKVAQNVGNTGEILYGVEIWNIHRADYQQVLAKAAEANGAKLIFSANVKSVNLEGTSVILEDGRELSADLIVGADGMRSAVRKSIPFLSTISPQPLLEKCYRCTVDKSTMVNNPKLNWLLNCGDEIEWLAPGKYVMSWPLPDNRPYDVVCCIMGPSDIPLGQWGALGDPAEMRAHFADFCPEVRELLEQVDRCVKWTLADLPALKTCRSEDGRIVLMGDAWHAMIPHAASGGASAIEDTAALAECIDWAFRHNGSISIGTQAYETLRKPRVERMQQASRESYGFLNAGGEAAEARNKQLAGHTRVQEADLQVPEEERRARRQPDMDRDAVFPSPPFLQWLYGYDAIGEARKYLAGLSLGDGADS